MKRFKSKKIRKKKKYIKLIFIFFFFFSYVFVLNYVKLKRLEYSVLDSNVNYVNFNISTYVKNKARSIINNPVLLLNIKSTNNNNVIEEKDKNIVNVVTKTTINNEVKASEPLIYIYNTHQTEEYDNYNVCDAAKRLSDKLNNSEFTSIYEEKSVKVFLDNNNYKYYKSYQGSRTYINEAINAYPSLKYFFDIHRDSVFKEKSTINVNGISYAKILLIVGLDNPNNANNLNNANKLNSIILSKVNGISRGVITKGGKGVNGVYNQDISENVFLIEVGGVNNTKEEVDNTIDVINESIIEYIRGTV